jgi:hypothetical protein
VAEGRIGSIQERTSYAIFELLAIMTISQRSRPSFELRFPKPAVLTYVSREPAFYSRVSAIDAVRMNGAASTTTGSMVAQAISHEHIQ